MVVPVVAPRAPQRAFAELHGGSARPAGRPKTAPRAASSGARVWGLFAHGDGGSSRARWEEDDGARRRSRRGRRARGVRPGVPWHDGQPGQ